ncbi:NAD(P)-dependent oxidoreductase [Petroclostridium sp. X23]|uniref:NAD-dependent epimerase/dehydratase family protein n=1 Tax=Petroclostridium sp. X23 TaxID=3045146 RepID=UPI0024ACAAFD|nr:NAD(P)-dependent oxidoreductase [Petroclostridium sp. X23]WHH60041.1 NAD(P)-dependent oxidoreductase [Petroclostridium sp. X23]
MKVVVTGAAGKIGRWTVRRLLDAGYQVIGTDKVLREESATEHFVQADLRDYGQACQVIMGADAVIHLANIPSDIRNTPQAIFENNMLVNFNVFEACKDWDIPKIVWASSETVMGYPFTVNELHYAPIDEEHPVAARSSYAMAKLLTEHLAGMYHDLAKKQIVALRFANIYEPDEYVNITTHWTEAEKDKQKKNLWAYCDVRDAANACLLALEKDSLGSSVFHITAADTILPDPSEELVRRFFPAVPFKRQLQGNETCMSIDKARNVLGYTPQYSWRNVLHEDGNPKAMPQDLYALSNV